MSGNDDLNNSNHGTDTSNNSNNNSNNNSPTNTTTTTANQNNNIANPNNIVNFTLNETITDTYTQVINQQGTDISGVDITNTIFTTIDLSNNINITSNIDVNITANLTEEVEIYDNTINNPLLDEIKLYAGQIKCENFHGKGTIDDYNQLFITASKIANETKQMTLDIDTTGFTEFGNAADDLASLFEGFILKLQNVNIINDESFLRSILEALKKIVNLSNVFGRFKETIIATTEIQIPKSAVYTKSIIDSVISEVNCAMGYIGYFIDASSNPNLKAKADLDADEKNIISKAITTIENWEVLCEHGVSISMDTNPDIISIKNSNDMLKTKSNQLKSMTSALRNKMNVYRNL